MPETSRSPSRIPGASRSRCPCLVVGLCLSRPMGLGEEQVRLWWNTVAAAAEQHHGCQRQPPRRSWNPLWWQRGVEGEHRGHGQQGARPLYPADVQQVWADLAQPTAGFYRGPLALAYGIQRLRVEPPHWAVTLTVSLRHEIRHDGARRPNFERAAISTQETRIQRTSGLKPPHRLRCGLRTKSRRQ